MNFSFLKLCDERRTWLYFAILYFGLGLFCFASLRHHLIDTHDAETFGEHAAISADFSFLFSPDKAASSGRLVDEFIMWVAYLVWGNAPALFHLLSVACHLLAGLSLALLYRRLGTDMELSFGAGLLFMLNVSHLQAVQWISALEYPLAVLVATLAVHCYARFLQVRSLRILAAFYTLLVVGLLTHIVVAMVWPFCLFLSVRDGMPTKAALKYLVPFALPLIPTLSLIAHCTSQHTSTADALGAYVTSSLFELFSGMVSTLFWFCGRLFTTAHWLPLPVYQLQPWELFAGVMAFFFMGVLLWRRIRPVDLWVAWSLLFLCPFLFLPQQIIADMPVGPSRYLYMASAGSSLIIAWLLQRVGGVLARQWPGANPAVYRVLLAFVVVYSMTVVKKAEAFAFYTSGRSYLSALEIDTGITQLRLAIDVGGDIIDRHDAYARMGLVFLHTPGEAVELVEEGLIYYPESIPLNLYKLTLDSVADDPELRAQADAKLLELKDNVDLIEVIGQSYFNLATGFAKREQSQKAVLAYMHSQAFLPDRLLTLKGLALALFYLNHRVRAAAVLERIISIDKSDIKSHYALAKLYSLQGEMERAQRLFTHIVRTAPDSPEAAKALNFFAEQGVSGVDK
ncbi:MAG: tetratricopeptide repeat protein [Candidatus Latescibacterota bacterium]|jgi:tetratricopeptide (TPR) repeat protein